MIDDERHVAVDISRVKAVLLLIIYAFQTSGSSQVILDRTSQPSGTLANLSEKAGGSGVGKPSTVVICRLAATNFTDISAQCSASEPYISAR